MLCEWEFLLSKWLLLSDELALFWFNCTNQNSPFWHVNEQKSYLDMVECFGSWIRLLTLLQSDIMSSWVWSLVWSICISQLGQLKPMIMVSITITSYVSGVLFLLEFGDCNNASTRGRTEPILYKMVYCM